MVYIYSLDSFVSVYADLYQPLSAEKAYWYTYMYIPDPFVYQFLFFSNFVQSILDVGLFEMKNNGCLMFLRKKSKLDLNGLTNFNSFVFL